MGSIPTTWIAIIYSPCPSPSNFHYSGLHVTFWVLLLTYITIGFAGKIEADAPLALRTSKVK